jgi:hypothetical protein
MLVMTVWAVWRNELTFIAGANWLLVLINGAVLILSLWVVAEGAIVIGRRRQ